MPTAPEIVVTSNAADLAADVAARAVAALVTAQSSRPLAHLLITGGGILEQAMRALRDSPARDSVDWSRVAVWWGDERFVPANSDDRNDRAAIAALLGAVAVKPGNVHRMPAADSGLSAEAAADSYARELAAAAAAAEPDEDVPHFDVAMIGIGPDGHVASLFPEHPGVYEEEASVIAVHNSPKPPPNRLSLTFRALDAANEVWFIASGTEKARAVALALGGAGRVQIPAAGPHGRFRTLWLLDRDSAAQLPANLNTPPVA